MWRWVMLAAVLVGTVARAEDGPGKDPRLSTFRTLYQGSGFVPPSNKEEWQKRAEYLREQVLIAAGLWPMPPKPELKAVIHGKIDRGDSRWRRFFFRAIRGFI